MRRFPQEGVCFPLQVRLVAQPLWLWHMPLPETSPPLHRVRPVSSTAAAKRQGKERTKAFRKGPHWNQTDRLSDKGPLSKRGMVWQFFTAYCWLRVHN